MKENSITFKPDTAERKRFFTSASFSHPAKMHLQLQIYLLEHYTKPGETVLDPMAGSGTLLFATALGRNVILVELEEKFVKMQRDNWAKIKSLGPMLGHRMGQATILQGDARNLSGIMADNILFSPPYAGDKGGEKGMLVNDPKRKDSNLYRTYSSAKGNIDNLPYGAIDAVISSPPYAETGVGDWKTGRDEFQKWVINELATKGYVEWQGNRYNEKEWRALNHGRLDGRTTKGVHKHPTNGYGKENGQIGNLPYKADAVITSPPYEQSLTDGHTGKRTDGTEFGYTAKADAVITSPPYEGTITQGGKTGAYYNQGIRPPKDENEGYSENKANIGNLKSTDYLSAMSQVYRECWKVFKDGGLMIIVVKNFIRDKKIVRLDLDTIKIVEAAGFMLKERLQRKLTQQSFWRIIYAKKYPDVEQIKHEDILIFAKVQPESMGPTWIADRHG